MKKTVLSLIFIGLIFYGGVGTFVFPHEKIISDENRKTATFPEFQGHVSSRNVLKYFKGIDEFASDNLPERAALLGGYKKMINDLGDQVNPEKAFRGKDNWLFLGGSYDRNLDKFEGKIKPNLKKSKIFNEVVEVAKAFQAKGVNVVFMLGPRKESVYPEYLPPTVRPARERYVTSFLNAMKQQGIPVIDPTQALIDEKNTRILYWKTDTHWNLAGGAIAFNQVEKHFGINNCPQYSFKSIDNHYGDLIYIGMFEKVKQNLKDNFAIEWKHPSYTTMEKVPNPKISPIDETQIIKSPDAPNKDSMWVIGDSFRSAPSPFASSCFSQTRIYNLEYNPLQTLLADYNQVNVKPKYILIIITERSF